VGTSENPSPVPEARDLLITLAKSLTAQTLSGKVEWGLADRTGERFIYSTQDASVIIASSNLNFRGTIPIITLTIRDAQGVVMETLSTEQPASDTYPKLTASAMELNRILQDLYNAVRTQSVQPEAVIKKMLGELGGGGNDA
jgi:hypothetical protein